MSNKLPPKSESTRTILGFHTRNRASAIGMDITFYCLIIPMELIFAFFGLSVILTDFHWAAQCLVAGAVVGVAVFTKIALYGRKHFGAAALAIAMIATTATVFFDFIGLSEHTSVRSMLGDEIAKAESTITTYNTVMLREAAVVEAGLEGERLKRIAEINSAESAQLLLLERRRVGAQQTAIDEREGVRGDGLTGLTGVGSQTKEREADLRRTEASNNLEADNTKKLATGQRAMVDQEIDSKLDSLKKLRQKLGEIVIPPSSSEQTGELNLAPVVAASTTTSIIERILAADSFEELTAPIRDANNAMAQASALYKGATGVSKDPTKVEVVGGNLFELSFRALFAWDIAAIVSMFLAMVFGWLDPLMAYLIRKTEQEDDFDNNLNSDDDPVTDPIGRPHAVPPASSSRTTP